MLSVNKNIFIRALQLIPAMHRKKGLWIAVLLTINAFLDFFSIASFIPIIFLIINPSFVESNALASSIYDFLGAESIKSFIVYLTIAVLFFVLTKNLVSMWITRAKVKYAFEIGQHLSSNAISRYIEISFLEFSQVDFTRELNRITNYPFAFANNVIIPGFTLISEAFICLLFLAAMAFYDFKMLSLVFVIALPGVLLYQLRKKSLGKINQSLKDKYPALLKSTLQVIEGFPEIKTYRKESYFQQNFQKINESLTQAFVKDQTLQAGTLRFTEVIIGIIICSLIIYTVVAYQNYQQSLLLLSVYCGASFRIIPSATRILHALQQIRMHEYLFTELTTNKYFTSAIPPQAPSGFSFNDSISFKNISFQYPGGPVALHDISLTIPKGKKIGIIGNSGEGKTTLLLVLLRFIKETSGEIFVDGKSISNEAGWRGLIGYVPQNPYVLDGTLCENIAFGVPPDKIDRAKVLQLINELEMDELVKRLPNGIESRIGERGAKLSGGQRQRLAIGRALYTDASILLLDEVTNQVHTSLELEIVKLLEHLAFKKKTIIMVTHKIPDVNFFDTIYKLENGVLHQELIPS